jgi:hypothetical protein
MLTVENSKKPYNMNNKIVQFIGIIVFYTFFSNIVYGQNNYKSIKIKTLEWMVENLNMLLS